MRADRAKLAKTPRAPRRSFAFAFLGGLGVLADLAQYSARRNNHSGFAMTRRSRVGLRASVPPCFISSPAMPSNPYTLGLDIGGTSLKFVRVSAAGEVLERGTVPIDAEDPDWPLTVRTH